MPSKKNHVAQGDEGFLRAAYDLQADMALAQGIHTVIGLRRTTRKGVYELEVRMRADADVYCEPKTLVYKAEWPRSEVIGLGAAVFQAVHRADAMLEEELRCGGLVKKEDALAP